MRRIMLSNTLAAPTAASQGRQPQASGTLEPSATDQQYVTVIGSVSAHFPSLSVEKEFVQAISDIGTSADQVSVFDVTDEIGLEKVNSLPNLNALLYQCLSQPSYFYIAREMVWTFRGYNGQELFTLLPPTNHRLTQLINALKPLDSGEPARLQLSGQIQTLPNSLLNAFDLPIVTVSHLKVCSSDQIAKQVQSALSGTQADRLNDLIQEILSLSQNDGLSDSDRGVNYVLYNNLELYIHSYQFLYGSEDNGPNPSGYQLVCVRTEPQRYRQSRVVKVIFDYQGINSGATQSWFSTVDVTAQYPYLLKSFSRYLLRR